MLPFIVVSALTAVVIVFIAIADVIGFFAGKESIAGDIVAARRDVRIARRAREAEALYRAYREAGGTLPFIAFEARK